VSKGIIIWFLDLGETIYPLFGFHCVLQFTHAFNSFQSPLPASSLRNLKIKNLGNLSLASSCPPPGPELLQPLPSPVLYHPYVGNILPQLTSLHAYRYQPDGWRV